MSAFSLPSIALTRRVGYSLLAVLLVLLAVLLAVLIALLREPEPTQFEPVAGIKVLNVLYGPGTGEKPFFDSPMGAAFGKNGRVYVADTGNDRIVVFDAQGHYLFEFGGFGVAKPAKGGTYSWAPGLLNYPTDVAIDDDGTVYVADFRNDQIQAFDSEGRFLKAFPDRDKPVGKGASGQGGTGIAVTSLAVHDGRVYATDAFQVVVFYTAGSVVSQYGRPGSGLGELDHPNGIAVAANSTVVVSDSNNNRIVGLAPGGKALWTLGEPFGPDVKNPRMHPVEVPRGVTAMADGTFIVADAVGSHLLQISAGGELIDTFGRYGAAPGELNFPTDVSSQDGQLLITEKGGDRVQIVDLVEE